MPTFAVSGTSFLEKGTSFGSLSTTGGTLTGPLTIGAAPDNALTITPGTASNTTIVLSQSGTGGMTFLGQVNIGPVGTSSPIALTAGSTFLIPATIGVVGAGLRFTCNVGFNSFPPLAKPTVAGSRGGNAALAALLTALASYGLVTDSSTA